MKKVVATVVTCLMLVVANYEASAERNFPVQTASTACYYVILVTDSNGNVVDAKRYLGSDLAVPCVTKANNDLAAYKAMYPAKEGYTVTLTWLSLTPNPQPVN